MPISAIVDANPSFIANQSPRFIGMQNGSVLDVGVEYGPMGGSRSHRLNFLTEVSYPADSGGAQGQPAVSSSNSFNPTSSVQIVNEAAARTARQVANNSLTLPEFYAGSSFIVDTSVFGSIVSEMFGFHFRRLISRQYLIKKVKLDVLDPPVTAGGGSTPLAARRRTENYSFVCPNGFTGLAEGQPNEKALCFNRYCGSDTTSATRVSSIVDRPSRFLVRGCPLPENEVFGNPSVLGLTAALTRPVLVDGVSGRTVSFTPKENILNDLRDIRAVQCVGFSRVAGQGTRDRQREASELESLRRQISEVQQISQISRRPSDTERIEGGR